jgi:hypothetical protein
MKRVKYIVGFFAISLVFSFSSCEDDEIVRTSTHTDASGLVGGTYTGTLSLDSVGSYSDVTVVIEKYGADTIQAVSINIQSSDFNHNDAEGLDLPTFIIDKVVVKQPAYLNVAKVNDGYLFSSGYSPIMRLNGRLNEGNLIMKIPILVFNKQALFHTNGDDWMFIGTKK